MQEVIKKVFLISVGLLLTSIGIKILSLYDLTFGGTAGIASILTFATEHSWGFWFFIVNLPFFIISLQKLGKWFTIYSLLSITAISILKESLYFISITGLPSFVASILAGFFIGIGVTFVLNNGSSLGGIHILALYLDQKLKINRGITIFISDFLIIILAASMVGWINAIISVLSIFVASTTACHYCRARRDSFRNSNLFF